MMISSLKTYSFFTRPSYFKIGCFVVLIHVLVLNISFLCPSTPILPSKKKKIQVHTVSLQPKNSVTTFSKNDNLVVNEYNKAEESEVQQIILEKPKENISPPVILASEEPVLPIKTHPPTLHKTNSAKPPPPPAKQEIKPVKPASPPKLVHKPSSSATHKASPGKAKPIEDKTKPQTHVPIKEKEIKKKTDSSFHKAEEEKLKLQQQKLLQASNSLSKIEQTKKEVSKTSVSSSSVHEIPSLLNQLTIDQFPISASPLDAQWGLSENRYQERLVAQLESALRLPDYGMVQLTLTLDRAGKIMQIQIIKSENIKNQTYLERLLPTLSFPGFGKEFEDMAMYTFNLTLRNKN